MARNYANWLDAYVQYTSYTEAPKRFHFWAGVVTIAGALRRKVWFDQKFFEWYPNFYVILVAPPGIATKSTTADTATELLRPIAGINFGPDAITWQSLVTSFAAATENFEYNGAWYPMSAITCVSSELGNLLNPQDRELVSLLITLWDGRKRYEKKTKMSGDDNVEGPWLNMIGCTTPHWIAENVPKSMVGGGFTSRCVFVYADKKEKFAAYLEDVVPPDLEDTKRKLTQDLEHMALTLVGPYKISKEAKEWGTIWYREMWKTQADIYDEAEYGNYVARKQTMLHKLAMVIAASQHDNMVLRLEDLQLADLMIRDIEPDMPKVFSMIGKSEASLQVERLVEMIRRRKRVPYSEVYRFIQQTFPNVQDIEGLVAGACRAELIGMETTQQGTFFTPKGMVVSPAITPA